MSFDPQAIYEGLLRTGDQWADCMEAADLLEATTKPVLAKLTLEGMADGSTSKTHAETRALASDVYVEHVTAAVEARAKANKAKVRYDAARTKASGLQTLAANERERVKRTGMD